jgi:hypothetical protein
MSASNRCRTCGAPAWAGLQFCSACGHEAHVPQNLCECSKCLQDVRRRMETLLRNGLAEHRQGEEGGAS